MPRRWSLPLLLLAACQSTGAGDRPARAPMEGTAPPPGDVKAGTLHRTSRPVSLAEMLKELEKAAVVYVGETHTDADAHALQLKVVEHLAKQGRLHAIGMEMFQRSYQNVLDDYVFGRIGETELLEKTEYKKRWGYDYGHYRPILELARERRIPVRALNVENEIRGPARQGGLDAVPEDLRRTLPAVDTSDAAHRAFLWDIYKRHLPPGKEPDEKAFENFYLVQCLWEDVMADSVVRWFRTAPDDAQMVVLVGSGHVANRYGIPARAHRRMGRPYRVVVPVRGTPDRESFSEGFADFVWVLPAR